MKSILNMKIFSQIMSLCLLAGMTTFSAAQMSDQTADRELNVRAEAVSFKNGGVIFKGTLYLPESSSGKVPAIVVFHAANGGTRDYSFYRHLSKDVPASGFAVLLFDRRGSGESGGEFETADFNDLASDGIAGIEYLKTRKEIDAGKIGVWGVSQGGWLGPLAATKSGDISFVVIVSGTGVTPAEQMDFAAEVALREKGFSRKTIRKAIELRRLENSYYRGEISRAKLQNAIEKVQGKPWFEIAFLPAPEEIPDDPRGTKWFREMDYDPLPPLRRVTVPILVFFGENERWIPVEKSFKTIREATRHNKNVEFHRLKDADHLMMTGIPDSGGPVSKEYIRLLLDWLRKQTAP